MTPPGLDLSQFRGCHCFILFLLKPSVLCLLSEIKGHRGNSPQRWPLLNLMQSYFKLPQEAANFIISWVRSLTPAFW